MVVWLLLPVVYCSCLLNPACVWLRVRCWDGKVTWPGLDPQGCHSVVKEKGKCESRSVTSDSTIHGILQARILEWVAFPFSRGSCQPRIEPRSPTLQADSLPADLQGKPKNTGVGSLSLLQQIFPTQESNLSLLHCGQILYQLSCQGSP